jgi:hypothetical protein
MQEETSLDNPCIQDALLFWIVREKISGWWFGLFSLLNSPELRLSKHILAKKSIPVRQLVVGQFDFSRRFDQGNLRLVATAP